jgi:hypothetical protein
MGTVFGIKGINNTTVIEKRRDYGVVTEWEAQHRCVGDCWQTITRKDIENEINGKGKPTPIICLMCGKDIVIFDEVKE